MRQENVDKRYIKLDVFFYHFWRRFNLAYSHNQFDLLKIVISLNNFLIYITFLTKFRDE